MIPTRETQVQLAIGADPDTVFLCWGGAACYLRLRPDQALALANLLATHARTILQQQKDSANVRQPA